jgi:hypothetical protein
VSEYARTHEVDDRKTWGTLSYFYPLDHSGPCVVIPIKQLEGMSKDQIANAVLSSTEEATITDLLAWEHRWSWSQFYGVSSPKNQAQAYINVCIVLGFDWDRGQECFFDLKEHLGMMETLQGRNAELDQIYCNFCNLLDGAYDYLRNKKRRLTRLQERARVAIIALRNGCPLCGLLAGNHTERCKELAASAGKS